MTYDNFQDLYSDFRSSANTAFGSYWEEKIGSEKLPKNFSDCVEEMISAMKRAEKISDIVIAKRRMAEKQRELEEAKNKLATLESSDLRNTECGQ